MTPSRLSRILHTPVRLPTTRRGAHALFACGVWPVITMLGTAWSLAQMPYYQIGAWEAVAAGAAGVLLRLPELVIVGALIFGASAFLFRRYGADGQPGRTGAARLLAEPAVTFTIVCAGIAIWYPAVLSQALFAPFAALPVAAVLGLLAVGGAVGVAVTARPGARLTLGVALAVMGLLSPAPLRVRAQVERAVGTAPDVILLGIDSLSFDDDLSPLADWAAEDGGTWYERAVTPGLLTNAVWTSILALKPVREHGVFHTFQRMPEEDAALLRAVRAQGYRTVALFPDQLTSTVGSTAGFDHDLSGPRGWRQLLLPVVANNSMLAAVIGPALPRVWPGAPPSNEAGAFTYDVRRDVRRILRSGGSAAPTFVAAHLTYVHLPAYPAAFELTRAELAAVLAAPARLIRDRTLDWQDEDQPGDPVPLNRWKLRRVQQIIRHEVRETGYLQSGGRLMLFSDHGSRKALTMEAFTDPRYHHVPLMTFGLPARCPAAPISLIDLAALLGVSEGWAAPVVEFTFADRENWPALVHTARLRWAGDVDLDERLLARLFTDLRRHAPWPVDEGCVR